MSLSCILTVGPEEEWNEASNTKFLGLKNIFDEVIIVSMDHPLNVRLPPNFRRVPSKKAHLAHQCNVGAEEAKGHYLSFLPFNCDFDPGDFQKLRLSLKEQILHYFELQFTEAAPSLCRLNAWAANLRADRFKLPFFEQTYTLDKKSFFEAGAFNENIREGADAEFVKRWRKHGFILHKAKGNIAASPQKYLQNGWFKTTARHAAWTVKFWAGKEPKELLS